MSFKRMLIKRMLVCKGHQALHLAVDHKISSAVLACLLLLQRSEEARDLMRLCPCCDKHVDASKHHVACSICARPFCCTGPRSFAGDMSFI